MEVEPTDPTPLNLIVEESPSLDDSSLNPSNRLRGASYDVIGRDFSSVCLSEIARYGGYSVYGGQSNTDPFVRQSLKTFSPQIYDDIYGFTRRPTGTEGMYKALLKYSGEHNSFNALSRDKQRLMRESISESKRAFKLPYKQEPLDWHDVGGYLRRDTAAGVSFMGQKKGDVMEEIYHKARWLGHRMKQDGKSSFDPSRMRFPPCVAGQRGAMSEASDPKTRLVWVYPAEMLVVEGFYAPRMYAQYMKDPHSPMLNGKSSQRLYTEWCVGLREGEKLYGLDFSSFDTKVPAWLIYEAFEILRQNIDWAHFEGKPVPKQEAQKWRNVWDAMVWYFVNTPILMPDGRMFRKRRGVPSGSWFTQMIDSVVNDILVRYLTKCQACEIRSLRVLGDDSAFRSGDDFDLVVAGSDAGELGMVLNPDKSEVSVDPADFKLLGTKYRDGHAHRPEEEWFKLSLYPESTVPSVEVSLSRLIGLWLGGGMWDKTFCDFIHYFQTCYPCPEEGWFSKEQRRWLEVVYGERAPRGWTTKRSLFWRSIFYTYV
jgi:hypothetical protein